MSPRSIEFVCKTRLKSGACEAVCGLVGGTKRHPSGVGMLSSSSQVTLPQGRANSCTSLSWTCVSPAPRPPERIRLFSPAPISPGLSLGHVTCDAGELGSSLHTAPASLHINLLLGGKKKKKLGILLLCILAKAIKYIPNTNTAI